MADEYPKLSEEYHKAHRLFVLIAFLIIVWQYVDFRIPSEATVLDQKVTIGHPEVIPILLFFMLIYFGFRTYVEWALCDEPCRRKRAAKLDFFVAFGLAVVASGVFIYQASSATRIAEVLSPRIVLDIVLPMLVALMTFPLYLGAGESKPRLVVLLLGSTLLAVTCILKIWVGFSVLYTQWLIVTAHLINIVTLLFSVVLATLILRKLGGSKDMWNYLRSKTGSRP